MNEGRDGDGLGVGLWGRLWYGGMYGVSHRRSIFGVWVREFSGDACRRLCPLTVVHFCFETLESCVWRSLSASDFVTVPVLKLEVFESLMSLHDLRIQRSSSLLFPPLFFDILLLPPLAL